MRLLLFGDSHLARVRRDLPRLSDSCDNRAVGGACTRDLSAQLADLDYSSFDVAALSIGTNDAAPWKRVPLPGATRLLQECLDSLPLPLVYVAPPGVVEARLGRVADRTNATMTEYAAALSTVAADCGARVLRTQAVLSPLGEAAFDIDGLHLSALGYDALLAELRASLRAVTIQ